MSKWIRKGDMVLAIAGNEKGRSGRVAVRRGDRVIVEGFNVRKKHVKRSQAFPAGGTVKVEMSMHVSNLALCDENNNPIKPKVRFTADGGKELVYRDGDQEKVLRVIKKGKSEA